LKERGILPDNQSGFRVEHQLQTRNQGVINTIVNHNDKIKNIENKFNIVVNNLANISHVKQIEKNTKELEKHVSGPPRPHSTWREFLLLLVTLVMIIGILVAVGKKCLGPCIVGYITRKLNYSTTNVQKQKVQSLMEHTPSTKKIWWSNVNANVILERQIEQEKKLDEMMQVLNDLRINGSNPVDITKI
jgi:hypothetical protein